MQISKSKVYVMAKRRQIPVVILGGNIRIPEEPFRDFLECNTELNVDDVKHPNNRPNIDDSDSKTEI